MTRATNPTVIILRGLPGSGKSTLAEQMGAKHRFVSDDYWTNQITGAYEFDAKRLGEAHVWNFRRYLDCCFRGPLGVVTVECVNVRAYEIAPYVQVANAYGLVYEVVTILCDPALAIARNVHGVSAETIWGMYQGLLAERLPAYWNQRVEISG